MVHEMKKSGMQISVQAKTALLKGYAHSGGMIREAAELFEAMCRSKGELDQEILLVARVAFV